MGLVDDHQVKAPDREGFLVSVDVVDHRLVGREGDAGVGVGVFVLAQDRCGHVGQQFDEVLVCLAHQGDPVGQEQDVLHPSVAGQHVNQRDGHTRLARSRCHHQQAAAVLAVKVLAHGLDGHLLVMAVGDAVFHAEIGDVVALSLLDQ